MDDRALWTSTVARTAEKNGLRGLAGSSRAISCSTIVQPILKSLEPDAK
jgi:hypothetical protein